MKRLLLGAIVGGLIAFAYGAFAWMVLPCHHQTLHPFINEMEMNAVVHAGAREAGVYLLPHEPRKDWNGPSMLAVVRTQATSPDDRSYDLRGLFIEMLGALLLGWLLTVLPTLTYWKRVQVITVVALIAGALTRLPDWNWWGFSTSFTLLAIADLAVGWFLAGLAIAAIVPASRK